MLAHQQLMDALMASLSASPAVAGGNIHRHRTRPVADGVAQSVSLRVLSSTPQPLVGMHAPIDWITRIGVECVGRAAADSTADQAAGPVLQAVHGRLCSDAALAGAGFDLMPWPELSWDQEDLDERIGAVIAIYTVRHRTTPTDLVHQS
jgi:hypothetical protein